MEWVLNSGRQDLLQKDAALIFKNYKICSKHFEKKMYHSLLTKKLKKDAVPTIFGEPPPLPQISKVEKKKSIGFHHLTLPSIAASASEGSIREPLSPTSSQDPLFLPTSIRQDVTTSFPDSSFGELLSPPSPEDPLLLPAKIEQGADLDALSYELLLPPSPKDPLLLPTSIKEETPFVFEEKTVNYSSEEVNDNRESEWTELGVVKQEQLANILTSSFDTGVTTRRIDMGHF